MQTSSSYEKAIMLYDGDCGFCQHWIKKWQKITTDKIIYAPYQEHLKDFPQVTAEQCRQAVQLILPDGKRHSGAHAVFIAFALAKKHSWLLWLYDHVPFFGRISEIAYQLIAEHRFLISKLYRFSKKCEL
jgi:predicted DCC family thiol-disulfide oxidoreductase YuxK